MPDLADHTFTVHTDDGADQTFKAAYFDFEDSAPFCTFKNAQHKPVASFANHHLVGVIRSSDD